MNKENILVAIDIGTAKISVILAEIDDLGDTHIIGFGEANSNGIEKGIITKPGELYKSIKEAVSLAEASSGFKISSAIINVGGPHLDFKNERESLIFSTSQKEIDENDINALIEKVSAKTNKENYEVIHVIPKWYILDEEDEVIDPLGLIANKLEGEFHIILNKSTNLNNIRRIVESAGIKIADFVATPIASANAVLYDEEKEMGVAVVDIGAGTTDIVIYKDGSPHFIKTLPIGGNQITMDIAHRFKLSKLEAENLKLQCSLASTEYILENDFIEVEIRGSEEKVQIERFEVVDTIEARLSEILEKIREQLENSGYYQKLNAGVVLTGGVANTGYIKDFAEKILEKDIRIGKPRNYKGFIDKLSFPQYATSIGIILFKKNALQKNERESFNQPINLTEKFKSIFEKIKNMF